MKLIGMNCMTEDMNKKTLLLLKAEQEINSEIRESFEYMNELEIELSFLNAHEPERYNRISELSQSIKSLYKHIKFLESLNEIN